MLSESYLYRFGGIARLYGNLALEKLSQAHFVVVGLGGVGTWVAESLARSGIGQLTLIELDEICITNTNRQLHTTNSLVGKSKNHIMSERLLDINPELKINTIEDFLTKDNMTTLIGPQQDVVIDAIDSAHMKARLVAYCSAIKTRLIVVGSSGGKRDPRQVISADLGKTISDPMLAKVRTQLYRHHNFSRDDNRKFRIDAVFSTEQMKYPKPDGSVCMDKSFSNQGVKLDCAGGMGSSTMVTGTFGFVAAAKAIERFLEKEGI
ncbi:tRNA threonylcarbamoyladenosine dehydratase [Thalassocella blandensis]|nr:tRNA threonylcarbamoyladenosine dehydratase [Thalassocella blandensis]